VNNDYLYAKAKRHTAAVTYTDNKETHKDETPTYWSFELQDWSGESEKFSSINIPLYEAATGTWVKITSDADKVASHVSGATGFCCDLTEIDYYHPITSFSIGSIGMATFCANVAVSVPTGIEAYYATVNGEKTKVILNKITDGIIPANTGVIITGDEGSVIEFTKTTTATTYDTNVLHGVTTATTMTEGDYVLYNNNGTAEFRRVTATELAANKAYLPAASVAGAGARSLSVVFDDNELTGMSDVRSKTSEVRNKYYDLSGRRVAQPTKGLYIVNGKKVVIK